MVQVSIILASHNERDLLWRTVSSCMTTCEALDYEIVVVDDASEDDCTHQLSKRFPEIPIHRIAERQGPSPTKDAGAQFARGEVLLFLDAHCKPEPGAVELLIRDVQEQNGDAIITPAVASLDPHTWINDCSNMGHGYLVELDGVSWRWISTDCMRPHGLFYETPSLIGCCLAISRRLYERLWGFDRNMYMWGVEDVEFGVKSWLLGFPVLHDPRPVIGHRFQKAFTYYKAPSEHLIANQLRMSFKVLPPALWVEWLDRFRARHGPKEWHRAWDIFTAHRGTAEVERTHLAQHQKMSISEYARRFGLIWPLDDSAVVSEDVLVAS